MFYKGDILLPQTRVAKKDCLNGLYHAAVVWDDINDGFNDFNGIMLTHSKPSEDFQNILMESYYFEVGYEFIGDKTHFVNQIFIKFTTWGQLKIVGKLTPDGIIFIKNNLTNLNPMEFSKYKNLFKNINLLFS